MGRNPRPKQPFDIRSWRGAILVAIAMIIGGVAWALLFNDGDIDAGTLVAIAIGGFVGWMVISYLNRRSRP